MSFYVMRGGKNARSLNVGDRFGIFEVIDTDYVPDPHYGARAKVRCNLCGLERVQIVSHIRSKKPTGHRGCKPPVVKEEGGDGVP